MIEIDGSPKNRDESKPRLGVLHLLVWILLNAVLFAMYRSWIEWAQSKPWLVVLLVVQVIQMATAVGGGPVLFAVRRWRGFRFPVEPGEWILVAMGTDFLVRALLPRAIYTFLPHSLAETLENLSTYLLLIPVVLWFIPIFFVPQTSWRWFFLFVSLSFGASAFNRFLMMANIPPGTTADASRPFGFFAGLILIYCVVADWRRSANRGWVHGVGVLTFALYVVQFIANLL
jgi:hypothetical protein